MNAGNSLCGTEDVGPQVMARDAGNLLHPENALCWNALPLVDGLPRYAETGRKGFDAPGGGGGFSDDSGNVWSHARSV